MSTVRGVTEEELRSAVRAVVTEHVFNVKAEFERESGDYDYLIDGPDCSCGDMQHMWPHGTWTEHVAEEFMKILEGES